MIHKLTKIQIEQNSFIDVDECSFARSTIGQCDLNADCVNTDGSYYCECVAGYDLGNSQKATKILQVTHYNLFQWTHFENVWVHQTYIKRGFKMHAKIYDN